MIYAELIFIDNFTADMLLLLAAARTGAVRVSLGRLSAGAAVGGAYAVGCAALSALSLPPVMLAVSAFMCLFLTGFSMRLFIDVLIRFWAFALLLAGGAYAAALALDAELLSGGVNVIRFLLIGLCAAAVTLEYIVRRAFRPPARVGVEAFFSGRSIVFTAAYDSGAQISDSTGGGVIIAHVSLFEEIPELFGKRHRPRRFYIRTAGGASELTGILPDRLILTANGVRYSARAYILLSDSVSLDGCPALIGRGIRAIKTTGERQQCKKDSLNL